MKCKVYSTVMRPLAHRLDSLLLIQFNLKPQAAYTVSGLELGGLAGGWAAGALSDAAIRR